MKNPNIIKNSDSIDPRWEGLKDIPFSGDDDSYFRIKQDINDTLIQFGKNYRSEHMESKSLMLFLFGDLQPFLIKGNVDGLSKDFDYWRDTLGEIKPLLAGYWSECDPLVIGYLFIVFVAQFLVILQLWEKLEFAVYCVSDCALLAEFFLDTDVLMNDMLKNTIDRWNLSDEGKLDLVSLQ